LPHREKPPLVDRLRNLIVLTMAAGIIGTFFGCVASRGLVRRLAKTIDDTIIHDGLWRESISPLGED
jgi:hypothetical protein